MRTVSFRECSVLNLRLKHLRSFWYQDVSLTWNSTRRRRHQCPSIFGISLYGDPEGSVPKKKKTSAEGCLWYGSPYCWWFRNLAITTLPETNIAHENPIFPGKYHQNCGFSMAMLVSGSVVDMENLPLIYRALYISGGDRRISINSMSWVVCVCNGNAKTPVSG